MPPSPESSFRRADQRASVPDDAAVKTELMYVHENYPPQFSVQHYKMRIGASTEQRMETAKGPGMWA